MTKMRLACAFLLLQTAEARIPARVRLQQGIRLQGAGVHHASSRNTSMKDLPAPVARETLSTLPRAHKLHRRRDKPARDDLPDQICLGLFLSTCLAGLSTWVLIHERQRMVALYEHILFGLVFATCHGGLSSWLLAREKSDSSYIGRDAYGLFASA
jgi:hypothetical protein